ncbi:MAG: 5'/3'-nucleotidase SurE [Candidatus Latescibacteria bacterium]|nr:5'/3'-nucleotidase SurE [Candidatus Latescibacterota bacterium]
MAPEAEEPWILVTNDDGVDSPALVPLLRRLSLIAPVRAVVPASERSWASKVLSRFGQLEARQLQREEFGVWVLEGYPADCANLGMHTLFPSRPTLVVSGVNIGTNTGLAYFLSSGTVGAAIEGALAGRAALAFSVELKAEDYARWRQHREAGVPALWENAAQVAGEIAAEVWRAGLPEGAALLNVNMPAQVSPHTPRRFAALTPTCYGSFFAPGQEVNRFAYHLSGLQVEDPEGQGDIAALNRGEVALTPIRLALDAPVESADRRRFERP